MSLLLLVFLLFSVITAQQTDDPFYFMNRGMIQMGQGLTEILTNQKFDGDYHSGVMEPHDMSNHMTQEQWYKDYYGRDSRTTVQAPYGQQSNYYQQQHQYNNGYGQNGQGQQYNNNYYGYYNGRLLRR